MQVIVVAAGLGDDPDMLDTGLSKSMDSPNNLKDEIGNPNNDEITAAILQIKPKGGAAKTGHQDPDITVQIVKAVNNGIRSLAGIRNFVDCRSLSR